MPEPCPDRTLLVQADCDGELDAGRSAELALHLEGCPGCAALRGKLLGLQAEAHRALPFHAAPAALRARLEARLTAAALPVAVPAASRRTALRWGIGAAMAAGLALALLPRGGDTPDALIASHIRALQPGHLTDVLSTDRHTVKPWFDGRVDFAPPVRDLAAAGFPLEGGRLDYLDGRNVAALVYRKDRHVVQLYIHPAPGEAAPRARSTQGFNLLEWREGGMGFAAISDIQPAELARFVEAFRAAR